MKSITQLTTTITMSYIQLIKIGIPSMAVIYKEFAEALSKSGRHEDSLTVCDHILLQGSGKELIKEATYSF